MSEDSATSPACGVCADASACQCFSEQSPGDRQQRQGQYLKIDDDLRRTIVFEVMVMKESLKSVCDRFGINFSSAKNVIQIYRKEGRLEKKMHKSRKAPEDSEEDSDEDQKLAPESQRCPLNLYVKPIEEEEADGKAYFTMDLEQLLQASPELHLDLKTQNQVHDEKHH